MLGDSLSVLPVDTVQQQPDSALTSDIIKKKSLLKKKSLQGDSISQKKFTENPDGSKTLNFKPNPTTVVWMGAIVPGLGQIINRSYWKLPLVYSSFLGCAYAVSYTTMKYEAYKSAYRDILDTNPNTNSFIDILPEGVSVETYPGDLKNAIKNQYDYFRRYHEISIYVSVAVYAIVLIDAYVDAQMFDFDISTDLSMQLHPALQTNQFGKIDLAGIGISIKLK